jgi:hypothetical protein
VRYRVKRGPCRSGLPRERFSPFAVIQRQISLVDSGHPLADLSSVEHLASALIPLVPSTAMAQQVRFG